jgi:hypothetical protein
VGTEVGRVSVNPYGCDHRTTPRWKEVSGGQVKEFIVDFAKLMAIIFLMGVAASGS